MSALMKIVKPKQILQIQKIITAIQCDGARKCHWYPDYLPGPYPKTKEEKEQAAKKYNLLPQEYEPYPNTEEGCGDYPKLPLHSVDAKDLWYPYDYFDLKKDFNEPVPFEAMHLVYEGMSTDHCAPKWRDGLTFVTYVTCCFSLLYMLHKVTHVYPKSEKQIPKNGVVHYTFELISNEPQEPKQTVDPPCEKKN